MYSYKIGGSSKAKSKDINFEKLTLSRLIATAAQYANDLDPDEGSSQ